MNNRYEEEDKLLIISPIKEDFSELRVKFEEKDVQVLYLAQVRGRDDDNSYDTYVFYHKDDKSFIFYEYENPGSLSYHSEITEGSIKDFWEKLSEIEGCGQEKFFKYCEIDFNYKELDAQLTNAVEPTTKPKKLKM